MRLLLLPLTLALLTACAELAELAEQETGIPMQRFVPEGEATGPLAPSESQSRQLTLPANPVEERAPAPPPEQTSPPRRQPPPEGGMSIQVERLD